jgi:hypothetical protein
MFERFIVSLASLGPCNAAPRGWLGAPRRSFAGREQGRGGAGTALVVAGQMLGVILIAFGAVFALPLVARPLYCVWATLVRRARPS